MFRRRGHPCCLGGRVSQGCRAEGPDRSGEGKAFLGRGAAPAAESSLPLLWKHGTEQWIRAYAAAAQTPTQSQTQSASWAVNARPRRCHSPRPTRAGTTCSYPQPLHDPALLSVCQERRPSRAASTCSRVRPSRNPRIREAPGWLNKDRMRHGKTE